MKTPQPETAKVIISRIRQLAASGEAALCRQMLHELDALEAACLEQADENAGLAEELLHVYEQLGIVFHVTSRLPTVQQEEQVLQLFVECLQPTYPSTCISLYVPNAAAKWEELGTGTTPPDWIGGSLAECRDSRQVVVSNRPGSCSECGPKGRGGNCPSTSQSVRVMCAPVFAGEEFVCSLVLGRDRWVCLDDSVRSFDASDIQLLDALTTFCGDLISNFRLGNQLRELAVTMVKALVNAIDQKDTYTSGHSNRVARYAVLLGEKLGWQGETLQMLHWSALLHDVGKIGIRDEVLKKPGKLTDEEFEHIKEHPVRSYEVVCETPHLAKALDGVLFHHERWDGRGYPSGLAGENIPMQARVVQLADIFDALTSTRSYRQAFNWEQALAIMEKESGTATDPTLAPVFIAMMRTLMEADSDLIREIRAIGRAEPEMESESPGQPAMADCPAGVA
jgi:hypothetical protein